ncbi:MAG: FKBP-type peptidyl-prolyl cis-trans isomerase [Patescibacteria group bacterium]|nr:FKBP-type peptidyl-prolyl cis-trans isomerase [Patescibacteria group bacterium]
MIIAIVVVAVIAVAIILIALNAKVASKQSLVNPVSISPATSTDQTAIMENATLPDGLKITDLTVGTGTEAMAGNTVTVDYVGTLASTGKVFDASSLHGQPFGFVLGAGQVIKGWDEGVAGMRVGGERKLVIPPALAYGNQSIGNGLIPANSTLIFTVKLLAVQP